MNIFAILVNYFKLIKLHRIAHRFKKICRLCFKGDIEAQTRLFANTDYTSEITHLENKKKRKK